MYVLYNSFVKIQEDGHVLLLSDFEGFPVNLYFFKRCEQISKELNDIYGIYEALSVKKPTQLFFKFIFFPATLVNERTY